MAESEIGEVAKLAINLEELDAEISKKIEETKELKKRADQIRCVDIPMAMAEMGYAETKLTNGMKISVKKEVYARAPTPEALEWLEKNNFGGLIKNEVTISFGKGEDEKATVLKKELEARALSVDSKRTVHSSTMKAFIKEQLEEGKNFPMELFGAIAVDEAKITHERSNVSLLEE